MLFRITGTYTYHTNDAQCVSVEKTERIVPFLIDGNEHNITTVQEAEALARHIICPVDLQYESITVNPYAETWS